MESATRVEILDEIVYFRTNALRKGMNPPLLGKVIGQTGFFNFGYFRVTERKKLTKTFYISYFHCVFKKIANIFTCG